MEFELTRHNHMEDIGCRPYTVTAYFKEPPSGLRAEAWRILLHIARGKELVPLRVREWARQELEALQEDVPPDDRLSWPGPGHEGQPGSDSLVPEGHVCGVAQGFSSATRLDSGTVPTQGSGIASRMASGPYVRQ